jgi:hypothetical protein
MPPITAVPSLAGIIDAIRDRYATWRLYVSQQNRIGNATAAYARRHLGWSWDMSEKERARLNRAATALIAKAAKKGGMASAPPLLVPILEPAQEASKPYKKLRAEVERELCRLAKDLPGYAWMESVRGFGALSLACIIGEAGDIGAYANPGKLWKRMGLAVMGDVRQGGLPKGSPAEAWVEHGYSARRRSTMWVIGDCLVKSNRDGEYRTLYLERKAYELQRDPEMKPIKAHRRAQRYMEKRLLRNLWRAWREASEDLSTRVAVPLAESFTDRRPGDRADGREAEDSAVSNLSLPLADPFDRAFARMEQDAG